MSKSKVFSKSIALIFFITISVSVSGQGKLIASEASHFLFTKFEKGVVIRKTGQPISAVMNYNTVTQEMIFEKGGKKLALTNLPDIDTVYLNNKVFVPKEKVFYEVVVEGFATLLIQHKCELQSKGKDTGYGKSQTAVGSSISKVMGSNEIYSLELPEDFSVLDASIFWVENRDVKKNITSNKKLLKLFPEKEEELSIYIKENKLKAKKINDLVKIVDYCNELYN